MIEIRLLEFAGLNAALNALHLPFGKKCNSIAKFYHECRNENVMTACNVELLEHDKKLLEKLVLAGDEHAKVVRGIVAYLEINAPRFWWQEMDTYRIGREQLSSESTMHIQGGGMKEEQLIKMKSDLKEGTMQKRVIMVSYQTLRRIYKQRKNHRLPHWRNFCTWCEKNLPMSWMITIN